ncbi:CHAD domain-containing protein [Rhizobium sp. DKSPLA3]|uniref:CHAD domain-containing protein n=1 Tax=Rhizobium quercicola TaxID=2901226 RepID=A0A9X1T269_9HYPH|nr:CHAD domain-containing protein [Rhizobium quercicola]MCD7111237.1 CHAD domain-containing protein [Rhizobium quercicola]
MAYRLKPAKRFTGEFQRIAGRELDKAIAALELRPEGTSRAIHVARRCLKRTRALYRLAAPEARKFYKSENARLRDASRTVADLRDATALIDTATILAERLSKEAGAGEDRAAAERAVEALRVRKGWVVTAEGDLDATIDAMIAELRDAKAAVRMRRFANGVRPTAYMLAASWRKAVERAQRALAASREQPTPEHFHTLRKRTQDYRFYHLLLQAAWPGVILARERQVKALIDRLGFIHDLAVLADTLAREPELLPPQDIAILRHAIGLEMRAQERHALGEGDALFGDIAGREAERIAILWLAAA